MRKSSTIKDVARHAGVSAATVSNVLHGKDTLYTSETSRRVLDSIQELDYRPNLLARSLVRQKTYTLGIVSERHHDMLTRNHYYNHVLDGFLDYTIHHDYQIKLITLTRTDLQHALTHIENGTVDGIALIAPTLLSPLIEWSRSSSMPTVVIGAYSPDLAHLTCIDVENERAMYAAVEWLIRHGHQRIGFVQGPPIQTSALQREQAYRRAMRDYHLTVEESWLTPGGYTHSGGRQAAQTLLQIRPPLTAIVAANDQSALGVLEVCRESHIRVPSAMSVIGFDDVEHARLSHPKLTTIHHPMGEMGRKAAELLIYQIETGDRTPQHLFFPGTFVLRASTGVVKTTAADTRRDGLMEHAI